MILSFQGKTPQIDPSAFIAPNAVIIGDVLIHAGANIWFGAVLRGDLNQIEIGTRSSIQDNCVLHCNRQFATRVRADVIVGHGAVLEGCDIGAASLIGMNATILSGSIIGGQSVVAAGSVVRERAEFPERALLTGVPAAIKRILDPEHYERILKGIESYQGIMPHYADQNINL